MAPKSAYVIAAVVVAAALLVAAYDYHGPAWQNLPAVAKMRALYNASLADPTSSSWYSSISMLQLFTESMDTSFDTVADDLPSQGIFGSIRPKLIHTVGVVGEVNIVSVGSHPYTGMFKGAPNCILRLSLAKTPDYENNVFVPGFGLKFLRENGVKSANVMAMYSLLGQNDSYNFFKHDFTNHPCDISHNANFVFKQLRSVFAKASSWPVMLGLSDIATYTSSGSKESEVRFPFRLIFHPDSSTRRLFPDDYEGTGFEDLLQSTLMPNMKLYEIWALDTPTSTNATHIGDMYARSKFTTSGFGDLTMFFQHQRFEDDLGFRPEWEDDAKAVMNAQASSDEQIFYTDLPFH